jgi:L-ribulose-5-phosphate 4-epimerase
MNLLYEDGESYMGDFDSLKSQVYACNMELQKQKVVIYTFGNVSAIDRDVGVVAIKPSGISYDRLNPEDIVIIDLDGNTVEGELRSSSDTKTHMVLYKNFPEIGGIVHMHSTYAVAWAQAAKGIPVLGTTHADHLHIEIPCTDFMTKEMIQGDYELETGNQIINRFKSISYNEVEMVLVAGHGPFTWGKTPEKAVYNCVVLEELAKMAYLTYQINPQIGELDKNLIQKHYQRKHGPGAYYGQK